VIQNLKEFESELEKDFVNNVINDLKKFEVNPRELQELLNEPSLAARGCGTHFYIMPASENLAAEIDIDLEGMGRETSRLKKLLLGFGNTMTTDRIRPTVTTSFRYWKSIDEPPFDLISDRAFITPAEFKMADHHIKGEFDEFGHFNGTVQIYDEKPLPEIIVWPKSKNKPTSCGTFRINLAYIQGQSRESKIPREQYVILNKKLNRIGGIYIYRDSIRVLPYGDTSFDFLGIEERRTKSAGYYYFSYRNFMGAIEITRKRNENLVEKAGREGFQENKAYREFKEILINFFIQIVADFFRHESAQTDIYQKRRAELDRAERARRKREKQSKEARRKFQKALEEFFASVNEETYKKIINKIIHSLKVNLQSAVDNKDADQGETKLSKSEAQAMNEVNRLREACIIRKPRGFGLTKALRRDWEFYQDELERVENEIFAPVEKHINELTNETAKKSKLVFDQRRRSAELLNEIITSYQEALAVEIADTHEAIAEAKNRIEKLTGEIISNIKNSISNIKDKFQQKNIEKFSSDKIQGLRQKYEKTFSKDVMRYNEILAYIRAQLERIEWSKDEDGQIIGEAEMTAILEEELLEFRERSEADLELIQLGMSIDIINHEFNSSVKAIRNQLKKLHDWAEVNPDLKNLYQNIRASFDHLDGYLTLFTPLHRRLFRKAIKITGAAIHTYLNDLFQIRMQRHQIVLNATEAFKNKSIIGYPSTFYPVFVNLIDNAIFWLKDQPHKRLITLDSKGNEFIVADNGPGVAVRDGEAIFDMGFTRKPGGRGLGLFISRDVLKKAGYSLELKKTYHKQEGATFRIYPNLNNKKAQS